MTQSTKQAAAEEHTPTPRLKQHFTRVIVQFRIRPEQLTRTVEVLDPRHDAAGPSPTEELQSSALWEPFAKNERDLQTQFFLPSVQTYFTDSTDRPLEKRCWSRRSHTNRVRGLVASLSDGKKSWRCSLDGLELYLFGTGIGMLVCELSLAGATCVDADLLSSAAQRRAGIPDIVEFNYALRWIGRSNAAVFRQPVPAGMPAAANPNPLVARLRGEDGITLLEIARLVLAPLDRSSIEAKFIDERTFRMQTYVSIESAEGSEPAREDGALSPSNKLGEWLFQLRRIVKSSYEVAPEDLDLNSNPEVIRTYRNIFFGLSLEGLIILLVDTGHPFFHQFVDRSRRSYFAHYILALHQRAALLQLAVQAAALPPIVDLAVDKNLIKEVRRVRNAALNLNLHHRFSQVSTLTPYARVYRTMIETLGVPDLLTEIRDEITELDEFLERYAERREAEHQSRLNGMVAVFGIVALVLSLFGMNPWPYGDNEMGRSFYRSVAFLLPTGLGLAFIAGMAMWFRRGK